MIWLVLLTHAYSLVCEKTCLDECKLNPSTSCIQGCCPEISISVVDSCSLNCEEIDGEYQCSNVCSELENDCESNCSDFCDNRAYDCQEACLKEFCGHKPQSTHWVFALGLIILFCAFLVVLYNKITVLNGSIWEREFRYS